MNNKTFDPNHWKAPRNIKTPNIEEDIKQYLGDEILEKWKQSDSHDLKKMILVITERLEFICHLKTIAEFISSNTKYIPEIKGNIINLTSEHKLLGHDFGGLQYDIEALVFYLHLTCIDAIQGEQIYVKPFEWLKNNTATYLTEHGIDYDKADEDYNNIYGIRKNFRKAISNDISDDLKEKISNIFMAIKFNENQPNTESLNSWNNKNRQEKLLRIANVLCDIRSKFTHASIRSFYPVVNLNISLLEPNKEYLLWNKQYSALNQIASIDFLLKNIIKELCVNKLNSES